MIAAAHAETWTVTETVDPMTDVRTVAAMLPAAETYADWLGIEHRPVLIVACVGDEVRVTFALGSPSMPSADDATSTSILVRLDQDEAKEYSTWRGTQGELAAIRRPVAFVRRWRGHASMRLRWTPLNRGRADVTFAIGDYEAGIAPVRAACDW